MELPQAGRIAFRIIVMSFLVRFAYQKPLLYWHSAIDSRVEVFPLYTLLSLIPLIYMYRPILAVHSRMTMAHLSSMRYTTPKRSGMHVCDSGRSGNRSARSPSMKPSTILVLCSVAKLRYLCTDQDRLADFETLTITKLVTVNVHFQLS